MNFRLNLTIFVRILLLGNLIVCSSLYSRPLVETVDNLQLDWGRLKIRFAGESNLGELTNYAQVTEAALAKGILAGRDAVVLYHKKSLVAAGLSEEEANQSALKAGELVARSTYEYKTEFFGDGGVRIYLENALPKALLPSQSPAAIGLPTRDSTKFSGLVLRSSVSVKPRASYTVVDETGKTLFDASSVSFEYYENNLMGRWYVDPTRAELRSSVGNKPISIDFLEDEQGRFVVQGKAWAQLANESRGLLSRAKIVVAVSKP